MKRITRISKWFMKLMFILVCFTFVAGLLFLFQPKYFIKDIESVVKNSLSKAFSGDFQFEYFNGNFITGFQFTNFSIVREGDILFSAKNVAIDPELKKLITGTISISELKIENGFYNNDLRDTTDRFSGKYFKSDLNIINYEISDLSIINSQLIINERVFKIEGNAALNLDNSYNLNIINLILQSPKFPSPLYVNNGDISFNAREFILQDIDINSDWFSGKVNCSFNLENWQDSYAIINIPKLDYKIDGNTPVNFENIELAIYKSSDKTLGTLSGNIMLNNLIISDIKITGHFEKSLIFIDHATYMVNNGRVAMKSVLNTKDKSWDTFLTLDNVSPIQNKKLSGNIQLNGKGFTKRVSANLELHNVKYDSMIFNSISGNVQYNDGIITSKNIDLSADYFSGVILIDSLINFEKFDIRGDLNFTELNNNDLFKSNVPFEFNGDAKFHLIKNNDNFNLTSSISLGKSELFQKTFYSLNTELTLNYIEDEIQGQIKGGIAGLQYAHYDWDSIKFNLTLPKWDNPKFTIDAASKLGDKIYFQCDQKNKNNWYISSFYGKLKDIPLEIEPLWIIKTDDYYQLSQGNLKIGNGYIHFNGKIKNQNFYEFELNGDNVDLGTIYNIIGKNPRLRGTISGDITSSKGTDYPIILNSLQIKDGKFDDIYFEELSLLASYRNRRFLLSELSVKTKLGSFDMNGWMNCNLDDNGITFTDNDSLRLYSTLQAFDLQSLNRYFPWSFESKGSLSGNAAIKGSVVSPYINATLAVQKPGFDRIIGETLNGKLIYDGDRIYFKNLSLITGRGEYNGFGSFPLNLNLVLSNEVDLLSQPIDFVFTGRTKYIEFLPPYFDILDSLTGNYSIQLELSGTMSDPIRNGRVSIQNGEIYLLPIKNAIKNINGIAKISQNRLIIDHLNGTMLDETSSDNVISILNESIKKIISREKDPEITKNISISGSMDINEFFNPDLSVHFTGNEIYLASSFGIFGGRGNLDLSITGKDTILITGEFIPEPYDFTIYNLGTESTYEIKDIYARKILSYDIHVPIIDGIKLETDNINISFDGDINITATGNEDFNFSGRVNVIDGKYFDNQGNEFTNTSGSIVLSPADSNPYIDVHAETRIADENIELSFIGFIDNPSLILESASEQYSQSDILELLTFRNTELSSDAASVSHVGDFFSNYLENEIEKNITKYSHLDEFQLHSSGSLIKGLEDAGVNLYMGKRISNKIYFNTQFNLEQLGKSEYEVSYRLNKNMSVVAKIDQENFWHLNYRIKYYYK